MTAATLRGTVRRMRNFLRRWLLGDAADPRDAPRLLDFSTHERRNPADVAQSLATRLRLAQPRTTGAMDAGGKGAIVSPYVPDASLGGLVYAWYAAQGNIGYQLSAVIAQHWLVDKACSRPARDAVRNGYAIGLAGGASDPAVDAALKKALKKRNANGQMTRFVKFGRVFGIRLAIFKVESTDPKYYEYPFDIDNVKPGTFRGVVQVDPYWCTPELNDRAAADPASGEFYEPTWWQINGTRYHRSHLMIFRTGEVADLLKPSYLYGGVSIPQRVFERIYAAERSANEAPQLLMTKRLTNWSTNVAEILGNQDKFERHMSNWLNMRDNYGVKISATEDTIQQFDTTLANLHEVIDQQYGLVCAAAGVPMAKLMEQSPKGGLGANGDYESESYNEELETIQENDLTPFLERMVAMELRSTIEPMFDVTPGTLSGTVTWEPLATPTPLDQSKINLNDAQADLALQQTGAIDAHDVRDRIRRDPSSGYTGINSTPAQVSTNDPLTDAAAAINAEVRAQQPGLEDAEAAANEAPDPDIEDATAGLAGG